MAADPSSSMNHSGAARVLGPFRHYSSLIRTFGFAGLTSFSSLLIIVVMLVAARVLGREDFGALAYAQALAIVVMTPVSFGLDHLAMREVSRRKDLAAHYLFNHMIWAAVLAFMLLGLAAAGLAILEEDARLSLVIVLTAAAWGLRVITLSAQVYFRPFDLYGRESGIALSCQAIYLVLGLAALLLAPGLVSFVIAVLVARVIGIVIALVAVGRTVGFSHRLDPRLVLRLQRVAVPIGISIALNAAYTQIDILILRSGIGLDLEAIGVYGAALKVYLATYMLPAIVNNVLLPRLSVSSMGGQATRHRRMAWGGAALLVAISLPMVVLGIILSPWIMASIFGPEYAGGTRILQLLFVAAAISFQVLYARTLFVVIDRQRVMVWITLVGVVARAGLVWWLSGIWGIDGAAIAVLVSEGLVLALCWGYLALRRR